ncbi:MAG: FkbM family methyltransferase [Alphaproteobacteria bacterium]|jgi:FkbM family methyltransferase|nr:FkbM family methyltransferase [Alphaproteobacteria bacterium]
MNFDKNSYINYGFDEYIATFQKFYKDNPQEFNKKLDTLKSYLDEKSIVNAERFINLMLKLPLPSKDFLVRARSIYNEAETRQIGEEEKYKKEILPKYYEKYHLEGWEKLEVNVFKYHCGLKSLPKQIIKNLKGKIFIDGGAFWGDSMLMLSKYAPQKIICFEPNSVNFAKLQSVLESNNLNHLVELSNSGLSDKQETLIMNFISKQQNHGSSVVFKSQKAKSENVSLSSLDKYLQQDYSNIGLIKLDVEGYGVQAIMGAENCIRQANPVISCAIYHNFEEFFEIIPLLKSYNKNYKFLILPLSQRFILKELTLIAWKS